MPHIPLYVPNEVRDPNPKNAYINTIEHIDTEVGRLLKTLDDLKLSRRLIEEYVVATVTGRAYGGTDRFGQRVSYGALQAATVIDGFGRLAEGLACLA